MDLGQVMFNKLAVKIDLKILAVNQNVILHVALGSWILKQWKQGPNSTYTVDLDAYVNAWKILLINLQL